MEKVNFSKLLHTMFERHVMMRNSWANNITQLTLLLCISISKNCMSSKDRLSDLSGFQAMFKPQSSSLLDNPPNETTHGSCSH
jgi:hypothetical protein